MKEPESFLKLRYDALVVEEDEDESAVREEKFSALESGPTLLRLYDGPYWRSGLQYIIQTHRY